MILAVLKKTLVYIHLFCASTADVLLLCSIFYTELGALFWLPAACLLYLLSYAEHLYNFQDACNLIKGFVVSLSPSMLIKPQQWLSVAMGLCSCLLLSVHVCALYYTLLVLTHAYIAQIPLALHCVLVCTVTSASISHAVGARVKLGYFVEKWKLPEKLSVKFVCRKLATTVFFFLLSWRSLPAATTIYTSLIDGYVRGVRRLGGVEFLGAISLSIIRAVVCLVTFVSNEQMFWYVVKCSKQFYEAVTWDTLRSKCCLSELRSSLCSARFMFYVALCLRVYSSVQLTRYTSTRRVNAAGVARAFFTHHKRHKEVLGPSGEEEKQKERNEDTCQPTLAV